MPPIDQAQQQQDPNVQQDPNAQQQPQSQDPAAAMMQLLQESAETIQMLANEIQILRSGNEKKEPKKEEQKAQSGNDATGQQKTASSLADISSVFGTPVHKLPDFVKYASREEAQQLKDLIEEGARFSSLGKVAEFTDGTSFDSPEERLEASLSSILSR